MHGGVCLWGKGGWRQGYTKISLFHQRGQTRFSGPDVNKEMLFCCWSVLVLSFFFAGKSLPAPASRKRKSTAGTSGSRCRPFTAGRQSEKTAKTTTAILRSERFRREKNEPVSAETGFFDFATKIRQNSTKYISYLNRFDKTNLAIMLKFRC